MKKLILISIAAAVLLLQPAFAQEPDARAAKIQELTERYAEAETSLAGLQGRADELAGAGYGGQVLRKDLRILAEKIIHLKNELKKLDKELSELGGAVPEMPNVKISAYLNDQIEIAKGAQVSGGDELMFAANVKFAARKNPILTELVWQLFDPAGHEKENLRKRGQFFESNTELPQQYGPIKINPKNLENGEYKVVLTHRVVEQPATFVQDIFPFKLVQAVRIKKMVITANPADQTSKVSLYNDEQPYLYVYYELSEGVDEVDVKLNVTDKQTGASITSVSVKRQRKPGPNLQRVGFRLKKGRIRQGSAAVFNVTITAPDGKQVTDSLTLSVKAYNIGMSVPATLVAGKKGPFRIVVPRVFKQPLKIDFSVRSGLIIHHRPGQLAGSITGITDTATIRPKLSVAVTDAEGRRGFVDAFVTVRPAPKPKPKPKIVVRPPPAASAPTVKKVDCNAFLQEFRRTCVDPPGSTLQFCRSLGRDAYNYCLRTGRIPDRNTNLPGWHRR